MLYCRIADDKLAQLIMIGGSRVSWQGQPLVETSGATKFAEWRKADGMRNPVDCFLGRTELLDELTRGSKSCGLQQAQLLPTWRNTDVQKWPEFLN